MNINKKRIFSFIFFIVICLFLLIEVSYISRNKDAFNDTVLGLKKEKADIDVLFIGGSSTYVYWSPMIAYMEYGFSSYDFSDSAMAPALMKGLLEESKKYCKPKLYVIDLRGFENYETHPDVFNRGYFQTYVDAFPYSKERFDMIHYAYKYADIGVDEIALHFDIICNHSNFFYRIKNVKLISGDPRSIVTKGQYMERRKYNSVKLNDYSSITQKKELSDNTYEILIDLLDYLKNNEMNALFLLNAYSLESEDSKKIYNSLFSIIDEYGFQHLDTNIYYEEIGLQGDEDFYDSNHVNALGAEKYTKWVGNYLKNTFNLIDHRGEQEYSLWDEQYEQFEEKWEDLKNYYIELIANKNQN